MKHRNDFLDEDKMVIAFSSIMLNVKSLNKRSGTLKDFMDYFEMRGQINGKILVVAEMVENSLHPLGFEKSRDYVFAIEQLIYCVDNRITPLINKPHPECEKITWLGSIINYSGNFVWFKES